MSGVPVSDAVVAIDGHVHLREPADDVAALRNAARNFAGSVAGATRVGALLLTEAAGENGFARLRQGIERGELALRGTLTEEHESLWFEVDGWRLAIIAGRQLVSAEGVEVLALLTDRRFDDGVTLMELIEQVTAADAIAALPWGCGKWLGRRRAFVKAALERGSEAGALLLGDNAGRPSLWPEPMFKQRRVLRGSDPLPLSGHWQRIGSFGSALPIALSAAHPAADLRRALRDPSTPMLAFGTLQSARRFVADQWRLRSVGRGPAHGGMHRPGRAPAAANAQGAKR